MEAYFFKTLAMAGALCVSSPSWAQLADGVLPELPPFPEIPEKKPVNSVKIQSSDSFKEV